MIARMLLDVRDVVARDPSAIDRYVDLIWADRNFDQVMTNACRIMAYRFRRQTWIYQELAK